MNIEKLFDKTLASPNENEMKVLKKFFPQCFDKEGNFLIEKFRSLIEKNTDISKESYSLEWLGKTYARVLTHEPVRSFVKEYIEWNTKEGNKTSQNLLIKGDNLEILKHMVNAYSESIKMIYIDPPYNTGNDGFVYQDNRKFTPKELSKLAGIEIEKAKRILEFVNSKSNSHSAWLTFMYPRLYIARYLLKDDGVIFVSIDDNESAQLRLLMDEIFGEENFIAQLTAVTNLKGNNDEFGFASTHEYIIVYAKNKTQTVLNQFNISKDDLEKWKLDEIGFYKQGANLKATGTNAPREKRPNLYYPIFIDSNDNIYVTEDNNPPKEYQGKLTILYPMTDGKEMSWRWNKEKVKKESHNLIVSRNGNIGIYKKQRPTLGELPSKKPKTIFYKPEYSSGNGTAQIKKLLGDKYFDNPKPIELVKDLVSIGANKKDIILDFFAGSGTTGDAVMQLNAEDEGDRKYILIQLPEPIDPKKNKTAYEFVKNELCVENPTIFDITKERLIRAAKKIISDKEKEIEEIRNSISNIENREKKTKRDEQKLTELRETLSIKRQELERIQSMDLGFKIYETIDIPKEILEETEELSDTLPLPKEIDTNTLLTTWKLFDGAKLTEEAKEIDLEGYTAYLVGNRLYLLTSGFTTNNLTAMLRKIDEDNSFAPSKIVANGYALNSKAQRELYEGILNFVNKKHIELEFIIRY